MAGSLSGLLDRVGLFLVVPLIYPPGIFSGRVFSGPGYIYKHKELTVCAASSCGNDNVGGVLMHFSTYILSFKNVSNFKDFDRACNKTCA